MTKPEKINKKQTLHFGNVDTFAVKPLLTCITTDHEAFIVGLPAEAPKLRHNNRLISNI